MITAVASGAGSLPVSFRDILNGLTRCLFPAWQLWMALAALTLINLIWLTASARVSSDMRWLLTSWPVGLFCAFWMARGDEGNRARATMLRLVMLLSFSGTTLVTFRVFNHLVNTTALPLVDDRLLQFDRALGFDWLGYANWVAGHPLVARVLGFSYDAIYVVIFIIAMAHLVQQKAGRAGELAALLFSTAIACSALGALFPAYGAMYTLGSNDLLQQLSPGAGVYAVQAMHDVRAAGPVLLSTASLPGLTTCPSFHTVLGLLCVYCSRGQRLLFVPATIYAAVMISSTPVFGGHYLFDILAGTAFTICFVGLWRSARQWPVMISGMLPVRPYRLVVAEAA